MNRTTSVFFCLLISVSMLIKANAQDEDSLMVSRIADEVLVNGKAYDILSRLTKQIGGRLAGSPQMVRAEQWGIATMKRSGADKVWMQECLVPHWVRGGKDIAVAYGAAKEKSFDAIALGNSLGTGSKGLKAEVIEIKTFADLESKKSELKGKIVFYNYPFNSKIINTFNAYRDAVRYRSSGPSRAAQYGAVGVVIRSMSHSTDNIPHTGALDYNDSFPKIPAIAVGLKDADWLSSHLANNRMSIFFKTNGHFLPDTTGHNVIGELRGKTYPDQIITVGGHLDSWDNCEGAHDDGAGCVQTIEVLRTFKELGYKPIHTIRFVLFANEENGTRGAAKYAGEAKQKGEQLIFALESDAGGFMPRGFNCSMTDAQLEKVKGWQPLLEPYGICKITAGGGGTDVNPLRKEFKTALAGLSVDSQRYFDYHHSRGDVLETVNKRELELGAVAMASLIYLVDKYGL